MTTIAKLLVTLFCSLFLMSCDFDMAFGQITGNGNVVEENLNIKGTFTDVDARNGWDVILEKGNSTEVRASVDENLLNVLEVYITGNTLRIETEGTKNVGRAKSKVIFVTYTGDLKNISASSGTDIRAESRLEGENLSLDVSSGGSINAEAMVRNVELDVSSGGNIDVHGGAETLEASVSSGGSIDARDLKTEDCVAEASSGGSIKVWVSNSIKARSSSGGDVSYWGNPTVADTPSSVSGSIRRK